jgi:hypothetical protein
MYSPDPDWLAAPQLKRRGLRALVLAIVLSAEGAGGAYTLLDSPRVAPLPAAPVAATPPQPTVAPEALAPEELEPDLTAPQPLSLDVPAPRRPPSPARRRHLLPPTVPTRGAEAKWIRLGNKLLAHEQFSRALSMFRHSVQLNPQSPDGWYGVALCDYELARDADAATALDKALLSDPAHPMANVLAGFVSQVRGKPELARKYYSRYLSQSPDGVYAAEVVSVLQQLPEEQP